MSQEFAFDFEWDPAKALANASKHGVTFEQAATVFLDALALTVFDAAHSQYEERWFTLGLDTNGVLLAVSHNFLPTTPERIRVRIISARLATRRERQYYENEPR
jgi:uncharacterized DUF497 family protein